MTVRELYDQISETIRVYNNTQFRPPRFIALHPDDWTGLKCTMQDVLKERYTDDVVQGLPVIIDDTVPRGECKAIP